jgi:hypothetical protein
METTEQDRVQQAIDNSEFGSMYTFDDLTQTVQPVEYRDPDSPRNQVTQRDLGHSSV